MQIGVKNDTTQRDRLAVADGDIRTGPRSELSCRRYMTNPESNNAILNKQMSNIFSFQNIPSVWIKVKHAIFIPSLAWYRYILNGHAKAWRDSVCSSLYLWTACTHSRSTYCQYHLNAIHSNRDDNQSQIYWMSWIMIKCNQRQYFKLNKTKLNEKITSANKIQYFVSKYMEIIRSTEVAK